MIDPRNLFRSLRAPASSTGRPGSPQAGRTLIMSGREALQNAKKNGFKTWNRSARSLDLSEFLEDASRRTFDDLATVVPKYSGPKLRRDSKVFAMGSCFAREIERALIVKGGNVVSVDSTMDRDEFRDPTGKIRDGFFHRFTPRSLSQEFEACFDELPGWTPRSLVFEQGEGQFLDLNYWQVPGADESAAAVDVRRSIAKALVRRAAEADVIIITLGLIEAWLHKPTGFFANFTTAPFLARHRNDFELRLVGVDETYECLETIDAILRRHHRTGNYQIVVTVSPVPLSATFTAKDIIVANMDSKSTLRAAAAAFVAQHDHAHYFPSYEMVLYSNTTRAWRPDRMHVRGAMVDHILATFIGAYYERGAF